MINIVLKVIVTLNFITVTKGHNSKTLGWIFMKLDVPFSLLIYTCPASFKKNRLIVSDVQIRTDGQGEI